jgi:hypothetical protein
VATTASYRGEGGWRSDNPLEPGDREIDLQAPRDSGLTDVK